MKFFKTKEKQIPLGLVADQVGKATSETKKEKLRYKEGSREKLLEEYMNLQEQYTSVPAEDTRLRMVEISNTLDKLKPKVEIQKEKRSLFKRKKLRFDEKICHRCNHSIHKHHKKGRSTGCKCGCICTIEEIMNPTDNGHDKEEKKVLRDT